jgi:hypothetical protein
VQRALDEPDKLSQQEVATLQRQLGNAAVNGLLKGRAAAPGAAPVQRAPVIATHTSGLGGKVQRDVSQAMFGRQSWKNMSTLEKMAMVPGGALVGAGQGAAAGYSGIYNRLAGNNPGRLRQGLAGIAAAIGGTAALPITAGLGAVRGAGQGLLNPIWSLLKRAGRAISGAPDRARGAIGNYGPGLTRDENLVGTRNRELVGHGASGLASASTGARAGLDVASRTESGNLLGHNIVDSSTISGASTAFGALGATAAGLGVISAGVDTSQGLGTLTNSGLQGRERGLGAAQAASGTADMVRQGATGTYNVASIINTQSAVAAAATVVAGGAAIAMGAIDMLRGAYGSWSAEKRRAALEAIANEAENNFLLSDQDRNLIVTAARAAARTQEINRGSARSNIAKGALAVAGGIVLVVTAATPIGWALLAGSAVVGGIAALVRFVRRRRQRREVVKQALPQDVKLARSAWKAEKKRIEDQTRWGSVARKEQLRQLGEDPLETWIKSHGWRNVDHAYAQYINDTANTLFENAVSNGNETFIGLLREMGLKVDRDKGEPKPAKIAKALAG